MENSQGPDVEQWRADAAGLRFPPSILISFQRFIPVAEAVPGSLPPSLGALEPKRDSAGRFLIPLRRQEGLWIGILREPEGPPLLAAAGEGAGSLICADSSVLDSHRSVRAGMTVIASAQGETGPLPFSLAGCRLLQFTAQADVAMVELVEASAFKKRTGASPPPPARGEHGYGGWRLP